MMANIINLGESEITPLFYLINSNGGSLVNIVFFNYFVAELRNVIMELRNVIIFICV